MDSKTDIYIIQARMPLEKKYEHVEVGEMTWDQACQKSTQYLSPHAVEGGQGKAVSVRITKLRVSKRWTYIPQW